MIPDHEVYKPSAGYAFRCPAWNMTWYYNKREDADYFLAGHLTYPVAPCVGSQPDASYASVTGTATSAPSGGSS